MSNATVAAPACPNRSTSCASVLRGHGHWPSFAIEASSISTTATGAPARVVECCPPLASGFSAAANAELGTEGPWRRGSRGDVLLERPITGDATVPVPTESSVEWTLVDTNWTTVSGPGTGWLGSVLRTLDDIVLVSNATAQEIPPPAYQLAAAQAGIPPPVLYAVALPIAAIIVGAWLVIESRLIRHVVLGDTTLRSWWQQQVQVRTPQAIGQEPRFGIGDFLAMAPAQKMHVLSSDTYGQLSDRLNRVLYLLTCAHLVGWVYTLRAPNLG